MAETDSPFIVSDGQLSNHLSAHVGDYLQMLLRVVKPMRWGKPAHILGHRRDLDALISLHDLNDRLIGALINGFMY